MQHGQWIGGAALALIFLFNALGVVDQTRAAHELAAHGAPTALVYRRSSWPGARCSLSPALRSSSGGTNGSPRYFLHSFSFPRLWPHTISGRTTALSCRDSWQIS